MGSELEDGRTWSPFLTARTTLAGTLGWRSKVWVLRYLLGRGRGWFRPPVAPRRLGLRGLVSPITLDSSSGGLSAYYEIVHANVYGRYPRFRPESGGSVVDVGANVGIFSVWAAGNIGPTGRILAIEPHPHSFQLLRSNLSPVRCMTQLANVACGAREDTLPLHFTTGRLAMATLAGSRNREADHVDIRVRPLDDLVREIDLEHIDLMKVDVEGWELEVLRGAKDALQRTRRLVMEIECEQLPSAEEQLRTAGMEVAAIVRGIWNLDRLLVLYAERR